MKKIGKVFSLLLVLGLFAFFTLTSCGEKESEPATDVDYVSQVKLTEDFTGKTFAKDGIEEVTLYQAVDGDTIHVTGQDDSILKLRFLGVDTPESTAAVEAWGVAASNFTKGLVKAAASLVITSDGGPGEQDNYDRWLAWVWYKLPDKEEYRLLNLELVQEGYSVSKNAGVKNYVSELIAAADQARKKGIKVWGETDPDYCYTEAMETTLMALQKDLHENGQNSKYYLKKVIFTATIARIDGNEYYLIDEDLETETWYGIQVFYRPTGISTGYMEEIGNRIKVSGTITYYETGNVYQLTDIVDKLLTSNKDNIKLLEKVDVKAQEITAASLNDTTSYAKEFTLVTIKNIVVTSCYTTNTSGSSSKGAITITGKVDGQIVKVRTSVLYDRTGKYQVDSNSIVLQSNFEGKTIDVTGIIEKYNDNYQISLISMDDVVIR